MLEIRDTIYAFSKDAKPVARIKSGDTVKFLLKTALEDKLKVKTS